MLKESSHHLLCVCVCVCVCVGLGSEVDFRTMGNQAAARVLEEVCVLPSLLGIP